VDFPLIYEFAAIFWTFAIGSIILRASETEGVSKGLLIIVKVIPAFSAAVFALMIPGPSVTLFHILLAGALVLCGLGDGEMEVNILPGLGLFLLAHITFTTDFVQESVRRGVGLSEWMIFGGALGVALVYVFAFVKYLKTSEQNIPEAMLRAVVIYAVMLSLTLSTSLLMWMSSGATLGFIPVLGSLLFVFSDSVIAVREFHHDIGRAHNLILTTYFPAIFLLSSSVWIFL